MLQQALLKEEYKNKVRDLHTVYIYGNPDAGKTTYPQRVLGIAPMDICKVSDYGSGKFDEYESQDYLLFDEFAGQLSVTVINDLLNGQPRYLPARYTNRIACYSKVFIISNYAPTEQYKSERANGKELSFKGFLRRINEIIFMPARNTYVWQKGEPTEQVKAILAEQGAKWSVAPQEKSRPTLIPVDCEQTELPF